jgi:hypothetical protein
MSEQEKKDNETGKDDETGKIFECGCEVNMENDDSEGEAYPGAPSIVFNYERCQVHRVSADDLGPIDGWMAEYTAKHPIKPAVKIIPPPALKKPVGCGRGQHDYQMVAGKNYAKCSKCVSTKTVKVA